MSALAVRDLRVERGGRAVVQSVSFEARPGELLAGHAQEVRRGGEGRAGTDKDEAAEAHGWYPAPEKG